MIGLPLPLEPELRRGKLVACLGHVGGCGCQRGHHVIGHRFAHAVIFRGLADDGPAVLPADGLQLHEAAINAAS